MSPLVHKFAPVAIVAGLFGWCCWPYLKAPDALVLESGKPLEVGASLLSPDVDPAPARDPFRPPSLNETALHETTPTVVQATPSPVEEKPPAERPLAEVMQSLALDATVIHGDRGIALINGKVYAEGDSLAVSGPVVHPYTVARISAYAVLIQHLAETAELQYRGRNRDGGSSGSAIVPKPSSALKTEGKGIPAPSPRARR
jgi:hypothetical protein